MKVLFMYSVLMVLVGRSRITLILPQPIILHNIMQRRPSLNRVAHEMQRVQQAAAGRLRPHGTSGPGVFTSHISDDHLLSIIEVLSALLIDCFEWENKFDPR